MIKRRLSNKTLVDQVVSELQRRKIDVFFPAVKDKAVSFVVKNSKGKLLEITVRGRIPRWIFTIGFMKPSSNYYFILYPPDKNFYVIPSSVISRWLQGKDKMFIKNEYRETLEKKYKNNFSLLA